MLAEISASQWGLVTTAQADARGVGRLVVSRLAKGGHLVRVTQGVYRDAGAAADGFEELRAAWLATAPAVMAEDRLGDREAGVVVAGASAAALHGLGDLWADRHEFISPTRRQSQRVGVHHRRALLAARDVTLAEGLPVLTIERTLADLVETVGDLSLVAGALSDAVSQRSLDLEHLHLLMAPLASRHGFPREDGKALVDRLHQIAGLDTATMGELLRSRIGADVDAMAADLREAISKAVAPSQELLRSKIGAEAEEIGADLREVISKAVAPSQELLKSRISADIDAVSADLSRMMRKSRQAAALNPDLVGDLTLVQGSRDA